jgi:hypothetical protein
MRQKIVEGAGVFWLQKKSLLRVGLKERDYENDELASSFGCVNAVWARGAWMGHGGVVGAE